MRYNARLFVLTLRESLLKLKFGNRQPLWGSALHVLALGLLYTGLWRCVRSRTVPPKGACERCLLAGRAWLTQQWPGRNETAEPLYARV